MGLVADSWCTLCSLGVSVASFWNRVSSHLSDIFSLTIPMPISTLLLNDLSQLSTPGQQKRLIFAGLTAAKKLVAMRWKHPDKLSMNN